MMSIIKFENINSNNLKDKQYYKVKRCYRNISYECFIKQRFSDMFIRCMLIWNVLKKIEFIILF